MYYLLVVFLCALSSVLAYSGKGSRVEGMLNVHLVCHTHDDVGWLKTVDQYYYGANNSIQDAKVQFILDTVVQCLVDNPNRKFIYVEQAFFQRWWNEQTPEKQAVVKKLVSTGQLEFINGGWCMHDEAATHYVAMVDQTTTGHRKILQQFGAVPKVTWQIDPFGHSATQASLLSARAGMEGIFFARIDYQDFAKRNNNSDFEMIWRASPSFGSSAQVFTGVFQRDGYGPPSQFNWDQNGRNAAPIQDDPNLEDYNVESRVNDFVAVAMDRFSVNKGSDIMLTLGSDFQYSNAYLWYKNLDKLIDYVNKDGRLNIFYSTPTAYVRAKNSQNITWSVKTDDFFPYADGAHKFWTGYFTSRPALKRNVRVHSAYLNAARQIEFLGNRPGTETTALEEAVGVAQHHDAVSGTSKQHVAYNYAKLIGVGKASAQNMVNTVFGNFVGGNPPTQFVSCNYLNETSCDFSQNSNSFVIIVYNPLARSRVELVRIPVNGVTYSVFDCTGKAVPAQIQTSFVAYPRNNQPAPRVLYFQVQIPALGYATYFVQRSASDSATKTFSAPEGKISSQDFTIENNLVRVSFSTTGALTAITDKLTGISTPITQAFSYYQAVQNDPVQNSGAYIFRPDGSDPNYACTSIPDVQYFQGGVVSEVRTVCGWVALTVRLVNNEDFVEFEFQVGEIPIQDSIGKEVISRFSTNIKSNSLFYTDSNGREFQTRRRNFRPTWNLTVTEPVAGNYYPINVAAFIRDSNTQFSVLNDRSQGCASIIDGDLELMIHRRLLWDDSRGVGEPLNETDGITGYPNPVRLGKGLPITGSHYVFVNSPTASLAKIRALQSRLFSELVLGFAPLTGGVQDWISNHKVSQSWMKTELPINVELMSLQNLGNGDNLLRLSHQFGVGEDSKYSVPVTIDLSNLFTTNSLTNIKEVSLTTNQDMSDINSLKWNTFYGNDENENFYGDTKFDGTFITIYPIDVRTFIFRSSK